MNLVNLGSAEAPKWYFVTTVNFNGEEQEIILAFTDYSTQRMFLYTITLVVK